MHTRHAQVLRVGVWESTTGVQRGHHGSPGNFGELCQLLGCTGADNTAANVQHGTFGFTDELGRFTNLLGVTTGYGGIPTHLNLGRPVELHHTDLRILGDVHEHGAGASGGGDMERGRERTRNILRIRNHEGVLGNRHGHAHHIRFLEGVGAQKFGGNLTGDSYQRNGVHIGVRDRGDQVCGSRP